MDDIESLTELLADEIQKTALFNWTIKVCEEVVIACIQFQSGLTIIYILSFTNFNMDFSKCFKSENFLANFL